MTTSNEHNNAPAVPQGRPFGHFRAEPFGWTDCAATDDGAIALYEHPMTNPWRDAVIEQLESWHIYVPAIHDNSPRLAIKALVNMECKAALDPAVSSEAAALAAQGVQAHTPAVPQDSDPTSKEQYRRMFVAACEALGAISDVLGCDPEDGGAEPILGAVEELHIGLGLSNGILGCLSAAPAVPDGLQWFTVAEHGIPEIGAEVIGGLWYTDPWIKTEFATTFMWGQCRVVESKHRDFKDGKQWCTFGPSHNQITHWARINTPGQTSAPAPAVPQTVYLVENRTCLLAYASREDADKAVASMPASVGGGFLVSPVQVFGAPSPAPAPAQEVVLTDEERADMACAVAAICTGTSSRTVAATAIEWTERALRAKGGKHV